MTENKIWHCIQIFLLETIRMNYYLIFCLGGRVVVRGCSQYLQRVREGDKLLYNKTCVREPPSKLTLNSVWCGKSCLSYKGTCHVILLAKLHDMYLYKTTIFPHQPLRSISKVAVLHRFYCIFCFCTVIKGVDKSGYQVNIFLFQHENICCGYSLEVPCQGTSNKYPQHIFCWEIRKILYQYFWIGKSILSRAMPSLLLPLSSTISLLSSASSSIHFLP